MDEGSLWVSFILFVTVGLPAIYALWRFGTEPVEQVAGLFRINDFAIDKIRLAVIKNCQAIKTGGMSEEAIAGLMRETARHSIAKTFAEIYPKRKFKVTNSWPDAQVIIAGNIAVVKIWIGHDYTDDGEGIRAVTIEINRHPALKLDTRQTIKAAFQTAHPMPSVRTEEPRKVASVGAARPAPPASEPVKKKPRPL